MTQLSEKELSAIKDLLSEEELLVKKFQMLAEHAQTPELKEKVFYGVIRKYENISTILDMLKKTQNIDYLIEGKKIVIKEVR